MNTKRMVVVAAVAAMGLGAGVAAAQEPGGPEMVSVRGGQPFAEDIRDGQVSDDGNIVAFLAPRAEPGEVSSLYLRDRADFRTRHVYATRAEIKTHGVDLSGNGRYLAVSEQLTSGSRITVIDTETSTVRRITQYAVTGGPTLSDDGTRVAFTAQVGANSTPTVYVHDLATGAVIRMTKGAAAASDAVISGNGARVAFRQYGHVYARAIANGITSRVDVRPDGTFGRKGAAKPVAISDNGGYVAFTSRATDLAGATADCTEPPHGCLYRHNLTSGRNTKVAPVNGFSDLSGDGKVAAFTGRTETPGSPGSTSGVFVHVFATGTTRLASVNAAGEAPNSPAFEPSLTYDGGQVTFSSPAANFGYPAPPNSQIWLARGR